MANKFYGPIGYGITSEGEYTNSSNKKVSSGVWTDSIIEKYYSGDVLKNYKKSSQGVSINDDIDVSVNISIISDPFAMQHFHTIKYVKWMGAAWKVTSVEVQYPRLILTIGGVYNGETTGTS